jgi:hypothetical protein
MEADNWEKSAILNEKKPKYDTKKGRIEGSKGAVFLQNADFRSRFFGGFF